MKRLPRRLAKKIQPGLSIIWWGRRAGFEIIEEISEAAILSWFIGSFFLGLYQIFSLRPSYTIITALVFCLIASHRAINEILSWINEIYIVCGDEINGGGRVYKFFGWANQREQSEAITPGSPTIDVERPIGFRIWGWLTGEQMERVRLYTPNHNSFFEGRKISPRFSYTINSIGGYKPKKGELEGSKELSDALIIAQLQTMGALDRRDAKAAINTMVRKAVVR